MNEVLYSLATAFIITLIMGPILIPLLYKMKFGQYIREDGPQRHLQKAGTPTMGGIMFLTAAALATLFFSSKSPYVFLVLGATLAYGLIGFIDDYIKVVLKRSLGLRAKEKLIGQFGVALVLVYISLVVLHRGTDLIIPFLGYKIALSPVLYSIFTTVLIVGAVNAVNLTDGLDGLAAGSMSISSCAFILIALMMDKPVSDVAVFAAAILGGLLGFLRYNVFPAKIFMGDTGSLALGGALAALAVVTKTELFLLFIGFIYMIEALSVIIQVVSFKTRGKRVFKMSPLHHHYELCGWSERKVVRFFWLVTLIGSALGILGMRNIG